MDAIELLDSYKKSASAAILDVTNGSIGSGTDPISFVICAFRSQAARIKELRFDIENGNCRFHCRDKALRAKIHDRERLITYGPIQEEDKSRLVYWDGECRGRLIPELDNSV